MEIRILKVSRGDIEVSVDGKLLRMCGEAMSIPEPSDFAGYAVYRNTIKWEDGSKVSKAIVDQVLDFIKTDFLKRKLLLAVE